MAELVVLGSTSKMATASLNQKVEGNISQSESSLFAALVQGLSLTNTNQEQLHEQAQDSVEIEEAIAELYSLIQLNGISLEEVTAKLEGLSTDKQQVLSQELAEIVANQNNTIQVGQLKVLGFNDFKAPKINYDDLALLAQEIGKQGNSNNLNAEIKTQNNININQLGNLDLMSSLSSLDLENMNNGNLNQGIINFNNSELVAVLKALLKQESIENVDNVSSIIKLDSSLMHEQNGYSSLITNLLNRNNNQSTTIKANEAVEDDPNQKVNVEALDMVKGELQPIKVDTKSDLKGLEATTKQANIEHLATNKNFTEELGRIMIKSFKLPDGASETKIQLHPQELGQIDVKLVANNGQISAQLITETALGKELLEGQIHQLKQSLIQQGYQVDKIEVQQALPSSNLNNDFKGSSSFNFAGQNQSRQFTRENPNHKYSNFSEDVDEFVQEMFNVTGIDYTV